MVRLLSQGTAEPLVVSDALLMCCMFGRRIESRACLNRSERAVAMLFSFAQVGEAHDHSPRCLP